MLISACAQIVEGDQEEISQTPGLQVSTVETRPAAQGRVDPTPAADRMEQPAGQNTAGSPGLSEEKTPAAQGPSGAARTATIETEDYRPPFDPNAWQEAPVMPELSPRAMEILREGIKRGNNPQAFAKVGDCESQTSWFLGAYDEDPKYYHLGPYEEDLAPVIAFYQGSF